MRHLLVLAVLFSPSAAIAEEAASVIEFCQQLASHTPDDDVNFKPGQDDVVPADLNGALAVPVLNPIRIPVRAPIEEYLSGSAADILSDTGEPPIAAFIDVYQDGRVLYNGQDISQQTQTLCADADGQAEADAVNSEPEEKLQSEQTGSDE